MTPERDQGEVWLHPVQLPQRWADAVRVLAAHPPVAGPPPRWAAAATSHGVPPDHPDASGTSDRLLAAAGCAGQEVRAGAPVPLDDLADLCRLVRSRGRAGAEVLRADPALASHHPAGAWCQADAVARLLRRTGLIAPRLVVPVLRRLPATAAQRLAVDIAFWSGVRAGADRDEWRWLTRSYVAFIGHRISPVRREGEERMNITPSVLHRRLRLLRRLGWRALSPEELVDVHNGPRGVPALRRRFVLTLDDGFRDAVEQATTIAAAKPHLYVTTGSVGGAAEWWRDAPLAGWEELAGAIGLGCRVGSHAVRHVRLSELGPDELTHETVASLSELRVRLPGATPFLAYPHGDHDAAVRAAAVTAGYAAAWTTEPGRNGPGTDRWCLRRVALKDWDSSAAVLFKALTGEMLPAWWERRLLRRWRARPPRDPVSSASP